MVKPSHVLQIELSQPFQSHEGLHDYSRLRGLVQLWGDPLGWIEVPIHQGSCSARSQAEAVLGQYRSEILKRLFSLGLRAGQLTQLSDLEALWESAAQLAQAQPVAKLGLTIALCQPILGTAISGAISPTRSGAKANAEGTDPDADPRWNATLKSIETARQQLNPAIELEVLVVGAPPNSEQLEAWSSAPQESDNRFLPSAATDLSELRNLAIAQARHEVLAFFSPQIQITATALEAIARSFTEDPSIAAVTGPVLPKVFSPELQALERHELMVRSFERQWHRYAADPKTGQPSASFRNSLTFDNFCVRRSALVGSEPFPSGPGSLMRLAFALCVQGKTVLYEPQAWVWGYSVQDTQSLKAQVEAEATARASYFTHNSFQAGSPQNYRSVFIKESLGIVRWAASSWFGANGVAKQFHAAEFKGAWQGIKTAFSQGFGTSGFGTSSVGTSEFKTPASQASANHLSTAKPAQARLAHPEAEPWEQEDAIQTAASETKPSPESVKLALQMAEEKQMLREQALGPGSNDEPEEDFHTAVRTVELEQPCALMGDIGPFDQVRLFVTRGGTLLGKLEIENRHGPITPNRLSRAILENLETRCLGDSAAAGEQLWQSLELQLTEYLLPPEPEPETEEPEAPRCVTPPLPNSVPVSIIITTCDRPTDLRNCLRHLTAQNTERPVEIIVADNRPASGITPPVIQEFPGVKLVSEPRVGGSYGRNSAFCASTGEIVVTVDDDVTVPPDWLEKLLAPMARPEVMVVTGNVLPRELETQAQRMYEDLYGGLSEGFESFEADSQWLSSFNHSPPVWDLGVSANSAFRATVFHHPEIGMMPEVLGPGTPVGGGEENYLIYRILKAGYTLVYEPSAYAWHRHRRTVPQLRYQIYRQMMGGTAYHILLWLVDKDPRGLQQLTRSLPRYFTQRLLEKIQGKHQVPWSFLALEIAGYLNGVVGYWKSLQAVKRQGLSEPYIPVSERKPTSETLGTPVATP